MLWHLEQKLQESRTCLPPDKYLDYAKISINWKKICDNCDIPDDIKNQYYKPGNPGVSLKYNET